MSLKERGEKRFEEINRCRLIIKKGTLLGNIKGFRSRKGKRSPIVKVMRGNGW